MKELGSTICFHCGVDVTREEVSLLVRVATKEKGVYKRWAVIGHACSKCWEGKQQSFNSPDELIRWRLDNE